MSQIDSFDKRVLIKSNWPLWLKILLPYSTLSHAVKIYRINRIMYPVSLFNEEKVLVNPNSLKLKIKNYYFVASRMGLLPKDFRFVIVKWTHKKSSK